MISHSNNSIEDNSTNLSSNSELLAVLREQIPDVLEVQLDVGAGDEVRDVRGGVVLDVRPDVSEGARDDALVRVTALHRVRLARARLSVREHASVEAVQNGRHQRTDLRSRFYVIRGVWPLRLHRLTFINKTTLY